jgi:hypothetical protein
MPAFHEQAICSAANGKHQSWLARNTQSTGPAWSPPWIGFAPINVAVPFTPTGCCK